LKGTYVLIIQINKRIRCKIGALGEITFPAGLYAYVGSAQNNIALRVARHLRKEKRLFWHIDYLLNNKAAKIINVYYKPGCKTEECRIASLLAQIGEPITSFGCSDCRCTSHLFHTESSEFLKKYMFPLNNK
jgi:Uri superfamily endonuclease